jgi:hypothetical protein
MLQPTISEVITIFKIAKEYKNTKTLNDLREIRNKRFSWYGDEELKILYEIDKLLGICICSDGHFIMKHVLDMMQME